MRAILANPCARCCSLIQQNVLQLYVVCGQWEQLCSALPLIAHAPNSGM